MDLEVVFYGLVICVILYVARYVFLQIFRIQDPASLLYIAPRGLITILLFFQIGSKYPELKSAKFDSAILLVVILVTCLVMTFALIKQGSGISPVERHESDALPSGEDVPVAGDSSDESQ